MTPDNYTDGLYWIFYAVDWFLNQKEDASNHPGWKYTPSGKYSWNYRNDVFQTRAFNWDGCSCPNTSWGVGHEQVCDAEAPNFIHFASGLETSHYKYVGRNMEANKILKPLEWFQIVAECLESVKSDEEGVK